jgi:hypothetical protein
MSKEQEGLQIKIGVDTSELDAAIAKAKELNELTKPVEYNLEQNIDSSDVTDPLDSARYAMKYIKDIYGPNKKEKLLVIELDDIDAVPKVTYKGQSMNPLQELELYWETATDLVSNNPAQLRIKSADKNCNSRTIGHNI